MIRALCCLLIAWALACGCASTPEGDWVEAEVGAVSERVLWQVSLLSMERNGWVPGAQLDRAGGRMESTWRTELQPFKGEGRRDRCTIELREAKPGLWIARVRVEVESNEELSKPLDIAHAQWEPAADDQEAAGRVLRFLQTLLRTDPPGPSGPAPRTPPAAGASPAPLSPPPVPK